MAASWDPNSFFVREMSNAIQDIRRTLIDEGWFGRKVTSHAPDIPSQGPSSLELHGGERTAQSPLGWDLPRESTGSIGGRQPSFDELWAPRERGPDDAEKAPDQSLSHDLER